MQKYKIIKTLGDGAFGTVFKASNIKTGEIVAIKKMKQKYTNWNQCIELREIKSLRKLNHPNVIKLKEVLLVSEELYMVFQYLDYNLYEVYAKMKEKNKSFTEHEIKTMAYQIISGLAHMHKNGFFHRDMKPENLLIYNNVVKVCDLGLAREIRSRPPFTDYVSTRWYRAPELLLRATNYNSPVDIFAMGCIMAELYTQVPLFAGANEADQMNKIVQILGTPSKSDWPEGYKLAQAKGYYFPQEKGINLAEIIPQASMQAIDLLQMMLQYSSRKRPTASEVLRHEYFSGIKLPEVELCSKEVVFEEKPTGLKLDTSKEDKKIDIFRETKQKFKETRRIEAAEGSNTWLKPHQQLHQQQHHSHQRPHQEHQQHHSHQRPHQEHYPKKQDLLKTENDMNDLDDLIKQLEKKSAYKAEKNNHRLPGIGTKDKFYRPQKKEQIGKARTGVNPGEVYPLIQREDWKIIKLEEKRKKQSSYKKKYNERNSRKGVDTKKLAYNFQPTPMHFNPVFLPLGKTPIKEFHHYQPLPKYRALVPGPAINKYN